MNFSNPKWFHQGFCSKPMSQKAFAAEGPVLIDIVVAKEEDVFPMVPAGAALHEMLLS